MKKTIIALILLLGTLLIGGCGVKQENKNKVSQSTSVSGEKVTVNTGEQENVKVEKVEPKKETKDNDVGTVKTILPKENKTTERKEATGQNETGDTPVEVDYTIKELIDYNDCLMGKEDFQKMKENIQKMYTGGYNPMSDTDYKDLCLPKYRIIGTLNKGDPDAITIENCYDGKPYKLNNFKKGDKTFEYNIAYGYGNVCSIEDEYGNLNYSNVNYKFNFYNNGKKLDEVNSEKTFFNEDKGIIYKQGNKVCTIHDENDPTCWEMNDEDKIVNIDYNGDDAYHTNLYLNKGKYKGFNYKTLFSFDFDSIMYISFFDNGDVFLGVKDKDESTGNTKAFFKSFNLKNKKINLEKYLTKQEYKKYLESGYKLSFLGDSEETNSDIFNLLDSKFKFNLDSSIATGIYVAGAIYTGHKDDLGFFKVIYKDDNKNIIFGTSLPRYWIEDRVIGEIQKVSVGDSLLKKLSIDLSKYEQDVTNYKNINDILKRLGIKYIYDGCYYSNYFHTKKTCDPILSPVYKYIPKEYKLILDKSKIKKVILKLQPEYYPFGEERYLYEVWINGKKIDASAYYKGE